MLLVLSTAWLILVVWLIARAFRQASVLPRLPEGNSAGSTSPACVAVIVPARNESSHVAGCLRTLLDQQYPVPLQLIVVDDESTDGTPAIVAGLAATDSRISLLSAPRLPPGWKGKSHACLIGARAARAAVEWLCFLDADMRAHPSAIARAVAAAESGRIDLLSLAPRHELGSFAERLIIPCGLYLLGFCQDLARIQAPECTDAVATGQFMLVRRTVYEHVGGHAAVAQAICEDVELARLLKRQGYRVLLQDGSGVLTTRMYTGWRTLWPGIAKNLIEMLGGPARTLGTAVLAIALSWAAVLVPWFAAQGCRHSALACVALVPALAGSSAALALHVAGAIHFGIPWWYGLTFPIGYTVGAIIALDSVRWRLLRRVYWKGRVYP
jgi:chlorobactene glucosyltransferase